MSPSCRQRYLAICRNPQVWRRALVLGLPVGFMQAALNQGDHWWQHHVDGAVVIKTILCPLLSCTIVFVSTIAALAGKPLEPSSA
jgi:hypothetical protein